MKWNKFQELSEQHSNLKFERHLINQLMRPRQLKHFVRTRVGFIAFRPFENLDLTATPSYKGAFLKTDFAYAKPHTYESVGYTLSFRVEGECDGSRRRYVHEGIGDGSIQAHIDEIIEWFESYEGFRGKRLIWEYAVKRTAYGSTECGLRTVNLEIFRFPQGYRLQPLPLEPAGQPSTRHT